MWILIFYKNICEAFHKNFLRHSIKIFWLQVPDGAVRAGRGAAEAEPDHGLSGGAAAAVRVQQGRGGAEQAAKPGHCSWSQLGFMTLTSWTSCMRHPSWGQLSYVILTSWRGSLSLIQGLTERRKLERSTPWYSDKTAEGTEFKVEFHCNITKSNN